MQKECGDSFLHAFGITKGCVVCIVGAGGKTSLMFHLGLEAKERGYKTLVSTTTKIVHPDGDQYDSMTLTDDGDKVAFPHGHGLYVAGSVASPVKIGSLRDDVLHCQRGIFDLILLESDGAACKSLKGWKETEPVIPDYATHTIGVVDITTIGREVSDTLVHRLPIFTRLTGAVSGQVLEPSHLQKMIVHPQGLFFQARGKRIVYFNKVESDVGFQHSSALEERLQGFTVVKGSVRNRSIFT